MVKNWISGWTRKIGIKVTNLVRKRPSAQDLIDSDWKSCKCKKITYRHDLIAQNFICSCGYHFDLPISLRQKHLYDADFITIDAPNVDEDPLSFSTNTYSYRSKIKKYQRISKQDTALSVTSGLISGLRAVVVIFNPAFGAGRFGIRECAHFLKACDYACKEKSEIFLTVLQSSGMDVQAGTLSLMSMPRSIIGMTQLGEAGIIRIGCAARGSTGGSLGSFFQLNDFLLIESPTTEDILFSGRRVTQNIYKNNEGLPFDFGSGSSILKHGLCDIVLKDRNELKKTVVQLSNILLKKIEVQDGKISTPGAPEEKSPAFLQKAAK